MQTKNIKYGAFYTLISGETVLVKGPSTDVKGWFEVWESDSQEGYAVPARKFSKEVEVPDPALPVISFRSQAALDKFVNAAIAKGSKK
jgi:hypothetical protein